MSRADEVLTLKLTGLSNRAIAAKLGLSYDQVKRLSSSITRQGGRVAPDQDFVPESAVGTSPYSAESGTSGAGACAKGKRVLKVMHDTSHLRWQHAYCQRRSCTSCGDYKLSQDLKDLEAALGGAQVFYVGLFTSESQWDAARKQAKRQGLKRAMATYNTSTRFVMSEGILTPKSDTMAMCDFPQARELFVSHHKRLRTQRWKTDWLAPERDADFLFLMTEADALLRPALIELGLTWNDPIDDPYQLRSDLEATISRLKRERRQGSIRGRRRST